ncbi:MAG TPA: LysM peptidoglycan-binding domain-containing protein [Candidatus Limnocylindria bacterium]|nr:LysM peptidoglycan-binding domain-containing protein [Candidatus Limnocylindria bacterium]
MPAIRYKFSRLLVGVVFLAPLVLGVPSAGAVESGGIGGKPARPDANNSRTKSIFVFDVDAGQVATNAVKIYNNSDKQKTIDVYGVDSQASSGGAFACAQKVDEPGSVGAWIRLSTGKVTLPAGGEREVPFTLAVPGGTAGGEHNGCIVIQEANQTPTAAGNGIALSFRSAIRVAVTVKGDIKKGLFFSRLDSRRDAGKYIVSAQLKNSGNVSLDTDVDVRLKTILGTTVRKSGGEFPILAGGESEFNFDMTEPFWGGVYMISAKATYNPDPAAGIGRDGQKASVGKKRLLLVSPKPLAAVIELASLALVVAGAGIFIRRHRTRNHWHKHGALHVAKEGENIQAIAEAYGLPWKTIVRVNHLKAPYHVKPGYRLKILKDKPSASRTKNRTKK